MSFKVRWVKTASPSDYNGAFNNTRMIGDRIKMGTQSREAIKVMQARYLAISSQSGPPEYLEIVFPPIKIVPE